MCRPGVGQYSRFVTFYHIAVAPNQFLLKHIVAQTDKQIDSRDPGLKYKLTYDPKDKVPSLLGSITAVFAQAPRVAILREQGVNGHAEMAFAFKAAGFDAVDSELIFPRQNSQH